MKKRIISVLTVLTLLIGVASAATTISPRWAYFNSSSVGIHMSNNKIVWSGDASTYPVASVTSTKVVVKLQVATGAGWGTIETLTDTDTNDAGTGGTYTNWVKGESYRAVVDAYAYNGTKELEHIGPFYEYLNT